MAAVYQTRNQNGTGQKTFRKTTQTSNIERKPDVNEHTYLEEIYSTSRELRVELERNTQKTKHIIITTPEKN